MTAKIVLVTALLVAAVLLGIVLGVASFQPHQRALIGTRRAVAGYLAARTQVLARVSAVTADVPRFRERLLGRDRQNVLAQAEECRDLIGAAWVLVTDRDGILRARTDYPEEYDIDMSRGALVADALSGEQTSGAFLDDRDTAAVQLYLAVATPLAPRGAAHQGVLVAAYALDDSLAYAIKQVTNADVVFFALSSDSVPRPIVVGGTLPATDVALAFREGLPVDSIYSAGGDVFGGFVTLRSRDAELGAFPVVQRMMLFAIAGGVLLALVAAAVVARRGRPSTSSS